MPTKPFSLRLSGAAIARLSEEARRAGVAPRSLAQELVDEGLRMRRYPDIAFVTRASGRRAVLRKRPRLSIGQIVETMRASDNLPSAAEYLSLEVSDVERALAYYAEFRDEIDAEILRRREVAEREERLFRERERLLGR